MGTDRRSRSIVQHARSDARRGRFGTVALMVAAVAGLGAGAWTGSAVVTMAAPSADTAEVATAPESPATPVMPSTSASATVSTTPTPTPTPTPTSTPTGPVLTAADVAGGLLSVATPTSAGGDLVVVPGSAPAPNPAAASVRTVRVEVEQGLDVAGAVFADLVMATLNDPRGWGADGRTSFARTDGDAQIRVVLASPELVDALCAPLATRGQYSCGRNGHAAINHTRWVTGTDEFPDLTVYRQYVVNHEVGHLLGHPHVTCPGAGRLAPIMQQQTIAVAPCLPNAWPFPDRV